MDAFYSKRISYSCYINKIIQCGSSEVGTPIFEYEIKSLDSLYFRDPTSKEISVLKLSGFSKEESLIPICTGRKPISFKISERDLSRKLCNEKFKDLVSGKIVEIMFDKEKNIFG